MITRGCGLVALAVLWLCAPACVPLSLADSYDGARIVAEQRTGPRVITLTIATPAFTAPTRVQVFLPAGYDSDPARRWPVTYYLHGMQGDQTRFSAWFGDLIGGFPSIVVAPDGGQSGYYSDWYNGGAGGPPMYETYDIDQLIPLIDARFRTSASRGGRALIGESMGGYGVMTYAARHPDLFAAASSMSGFVDSNYAPAIAIVSAGPLLQGGLPDAIYGSYATEEVRWRGHNPTDLATNLRDVALQVRTAEGVPTTTIEGTDPTSAVGCTEEAGIFQTSTDFHQQLLALGVSHVWKDYGTGCHDTLNFRREFTDSLPGLERVFAHPRPDPSAITYRSIEPHFAVWGWRVDADPARALEFLQIQQAGRGGLTLVGSGRTNVTTPPFFPGLTAVEVVTSGRVSVLRPDHAGRLHFTVDLGPAHTNQQYTEASQLAGDGTPGYFTSRTVTFVPRASRHSAGSKTARRA
ncbi:MAG TPA: alpha/beta hydrolase family protein [Solirubrobacteraceae bacterium]|nr:alpha/beta hydrolase family protein [Solirubrobacteraceae bacterium]